MSCLQTTFLFNVTDTRDTLDDRSVTQKQVVESVLNSNILKCSASFPSSSLATPK